MCQEIRKFSWGYRWNPGMRLDGHTQKTPLTSPVCSRTVTTWWNFSYLWGICPPCRHRLTGSSWQQQQQQLCNGFPIKSDALSLTFRATSAVWIIEVCLLSYLQDQFDTLELSDNDIRKVDGFPLLRRLKCLILNNNRVALVPPLLLLLPYLTFGACRFLHLPGAEAMTAVSLYAVITLLFANIFGGCGVWKLMIGESTSC